MEKGQRSQINWTCFPPFGGFFIGQVGHEFIKRPFFLETAVFFDPS
ncbi:MAG: hypothetical protein AAF490_29840 [Chloroflexota bacterium]